MLFLSRPTGAFLKLAALGFRPLRAMQYGS